MILAYFDGEPAASAAASALQDLGFDAEVLDAGTSQYADDVKRFIRGEVDGFEPKVLLRSDADEDTFETVVRRHYGRVETGTI
jgi:hypothetical protein